MVESRFFKSHSTLTVGEIASLTGAAPRAAAQLDLRITGIGTIDQAGPTELTFLEGEKFANALSTTRAGAILIHERFASRAPSAPNVLVARDPYRAFIAVTNAMFPSTARPSSLFGTEGVAPGAFVHPSARLEGGVVVDPGAMIGPGAEIGAGSFVGPMAVVGPNVRIGRDCAIGASSSVTHATIGDRVIIHPGCHIGQDGLGFVPGARGHLKVPQIGSVIVHNDVEIGAGTTIDRGGIRDTIIGEGSKIDNFVQIGHNVVIGRHCIVVAQSGISGSVTL
jgi:UDP-3-O-[3-hydroxymyristoyl] glucosamine N-acyltransferase